MRLIDADKLIRCLRNDPLFEFIEQFGVTGVIDAQPTVDAVPVIRCKDCRYWLEKYHYCELISDTFKDWGADDYCSMAERKEE